jgi:hypothetical protein
MADDREIRIEPGEPEPGDGTSTWGSPGRASRRLVQERSRWREGLGVLAVAGLVAAVLLTVFGPDGRGDGRDDRDGRDGRPGRGDDQADGERGGVIAPRVVWAEATLRLAEAGSLAYRGTVHAEAAGPMRPGAFVAEDVSVEGAVVLPDALTRETAVAPDGEAVETVTSGATVWSRTAPSADELPGAPWERLAGPGPEPFGWYRSSLPARMGLALVLDVLAPAGNRRSDPPDGTGRRTLHATVPNRSPARVDLVRGAEVSLTLGDGGGVERVAITDGPADDPELAMDLAIERVGDAGLVTPADVDEPARRTVRMDALDAAHLAAVEPGRLPAGWGLTGALAAPGGDNEGLDRCPQLRLDYRDLALDDDGWLALSVASDSCRARQGRGGARPQRLRAGSFSGSALEGSRFTSGSVSDGVTAVGFVTNLSVADVRGVLASLVPFDNRAEP